MKTKLLKTAYCITILLSLSTVEAHICRATVPLPLLLIAGFSEIFFSFDPLMLTCVLSVLSLLLFIFIGNIKSEIVFITAAVISLWILTLNLGEVEGNLIRLLPLTVCTLAVPLILLKLTKIKKSNQSIESDI